MFAVSSIWVGKHPGAFDTPQSGCGDGLTMCGQRIQEPLKALDGDGGGGDGGSDDEKEDSTDDNKTDSDQGKNPSALNSSD